MKKYMKFTMYEKESKDKNEKPEQVEIVITGNPVVEIISSK